MLERQTLGVCNVDVRAGTTEDDVLRAVSQAGGSVLATCRVEGSRTTLVYVQGVEPLQRHGDKRLRLESEGWVGVLRLTGGSLRMGCECLQGQATSCAEFVNRLRL